MPKITDEPLVDVHIRLFGADLQRLENLFGKSRGGFGVNRAVRTIVRAFLNQTESQMRKAVDEAERKNNA